MATNDNIQHGIDNNPSGDAEKGAALGGLGGAAVGAAAGALAGPVGAIVGAVAGGLLGAGASGAAVAAVDALDNDNTITGVGDGVTPASSVHPTTPISSGPTAVPYDSPDYYDPAVTNNIRASSDAPVVGTEVGGHNVVTGGPATSEAGNTGLATGAIVGGVLGTAVGGPVGAVVGGTLGSLAGGVAGDAAEAADDAEAIDAATPTYNATTPPIVTSPVAGTGVDTPGAYVSGAALQNLAGQGYAADNNYAGDAYRASAGIGDNPDTNLSPTRDTYSGTTSVGAADLNADTGVLGGASTPGVRVGNDTPGIQTGGVTTAGTDTRGIAEKAADALTGDRIDDKTGGTVLNQPNNNR
ncbi:hypothetical protein EON83_18775 [bacterium]|nr:MAG: hypothetical protein EON83_18775 [bacterium]